MSPDSTMATTTLSLDTTRIQKLSSNNWHTWKFKMQLVLEEKELWDVVDGSERQPTVTKELEELTKGELFEFQQELLIWEKKDRKARATIILGVEDSRKLLRVH